MPSGILKTGSKQPFTLDEWFSEIFGYSVYRWYFNEWEGDSFEGFQSESNRQFGYLTGQGPLFIYSKVPTSEMEAIRYCAGKKFYLVDTNLILEKKTEEGKGVQKSPNVKVRFSTARDELPLIEFAKHNFSYSRFHLDPEIPETLANEIKGEWVRSFFLRKRGSRMIVAEVDSRIAGFLLLLKDSKNQLTIDLMAVGKEHRRKGIGRQMIIFLEENFPKGALLRVGTQVSNIPSTAFYESLGFKLAASQYVFHYHQMG